ncbi:Radical SAM superfamily enzyme, MoaA/NifB/PqqE/SkfB family [Desulfonatronum thiosulfatophilum]|uniref:Radical SAM superfamily enzyme, MoaA/NifB/PqqE/SkfB family n=1 Tax=Desulfonatronum thiosulfatophilum TaxID=617002 RepID=A0A1G6AK45_9BACT|nr:radical SAM protein [Desulfonatronum thiosulfatophilum]SDB08781.1 Radical SAM superfamily enzyme, MoaA/NifB/PqqE/SkfB family [Desulfonatronum thiosulfatophilum]
MMNAEQMPTAHVLGAMTGNRLASPNNLMWNMTRKCNFRCSYCYYPHDASPVTDVLPVEPVLKLLDENPVQYSEIGGVTDQRDRSWVVGLTGGEPLLYPGFIDICQALTRNHYIGLDSNLSISSRVRDFVEKIDPSRVSYVYASLHIEERERVKGVDSFISNVVLFLQKGFNIIVNCVLHPTLVDRFPEMLDYFARQGVSIVPRPFKGEHAGKRYPEAYGPEVRAIFAGHPQAGAKMVYNFKEVPCYGGMAFTRMEPDGTILRCSGDKTQLGNVRDSVHLHSRPLPCRVSKCPCRGLDWVVLSPEQQAFVEGLRLAVTGDRQAARGAWERCIALNPAMSNAWNNLGLLDWEDGNPDLAGKRFQKALDIHPGHDLYLRNLHLHKEFAPFLSNEVAPHGAGVRNSGIPTEYPP